MRNTIVHSLESIFGAFILILGLLYLTEQDKNLNLLVSTVNEKILETENVYQEYNILNLDQITNETLYTIVMGYREYPITIDGILIGPDDSDYEYYFTLIKEGFYQKKYDYDTNHNIIQVNFTYKGI